MILRKKSEEKTINLNFCLQIMYSDTCCTNTKIATAKCSHHPKLAESFACICQISSKFGKNWPYVLGCLKKRVKQEKTYSEKIDGNV